jgi:hypothetical protein
MLVVWPTPRPSSAREHRDPQGMILQHHMALALDNIIFIII